MRLGGRGVSGRRREKAGVVTEADSQSFFIGRRGRERLVHQRVKVWIIFSHFGVMSDRAQLTIAANAFGVVDRAQLAAPRT